MENEVSSQNSSLPPMESTEPSAAKRPRVEGPAPQAPPQSAGSANEGQGSGEGAYHQGASFGLNFVTFAEYSGLRSEHEKLQGQLESVKKFVHENAGQAVRAEINALREENKRLQQEVAELRQQLHSSGVPPVSSTADGMSWSDEGRLTSVETQLSSITSRLAHLPPAPSQETVKYLKNLAAFFSTTPADSPTDTLNISSSEPNMTPVKFDHVDTQLSPEKSVSGLLPMATSINSINSMPEAVTGSQSLPLPEETQEPITPSQPAPEESPYSLKVQLLPKYNMWVNRSKLTTLLQDSMAQSDNAPLYLLRKLIPVVFSWEELAFSRGQGITTKSRDEGKAPLDAVKINACKDFMRLFCSQNNLVEPPDTAINTTFTHTITYARTKMKRSLGKPNCKVSTLMSDHSSPLKDDSLQFAEETNLDLSHFETSPDPGRGEEPMKDGEATPIKSQYFPTS